MRDRQTNKKTAPIYEGQELDGDKTQLEPQQLLFQIKDNKLMFQITLRLCRILWIWYAVGSEGDF